MTTKLPENFWEEYRARVPKGQNPDPDDTEAWKLREKIIESHVYLIQRFVSSIKKKMPAHVEREELESLGGIGLMQAVLRYDATLGVPFEFFVGQRIHSVVGDAVRKADWAPRSLRAKERVIKKGVEEFVKNEGREPNARELADRLEIPLGDLEKTKHESFIASHAYIEASTEAQNKAASLDPEEDELVSLMRQITASAMKDLPVRLAAIVALHYYEGKKLADVAQLLNSSEVKIGQLHAEAVLFIWDRVQEALKSDDA